MISNVSQFRSIRVDETAEANVPLVSGHTGVLAEIGDAFRLEEVFVDEEVSGAGARIFAENGIGGVGHDLRFPGHGHGSITVDHVHGCGVDQFGRPERVGRDVIFPELLGHPQDAHGHAVLGDRVG